MLCLSSTRSQTEHNEFFPIASRKENFVVFLDEKENFAAASSSSSSSKIVQKLIIKIELELNENFFRSQMEQAQNQNHIIKRNTENKISVYK
jgi:hypothetical protein